MRPNKNTVATHTAATATAAPGTSDVERVIGAFEALMHRLMASHAPELSAVDLTMSQTKGLYLILAAGQLRMSELAARLGVTSSTATGQVDRLVELGLLERHEDPADRRQVVVTATALAESTLEQFRELNSHRMRELLGRLGDDDLAVVERTIQVLSSAIDAEASDIEPSNHITATTGSHS